MRYLKTYNETLNFDNEIVETIKNHLMELEDIDNWKQYVDNQEMGECQTIVSHIMRMKLPGVEKCFGEIQIKDALYEEDYDKIMTHHWVKINGEIYDFSKGTLKDWVSFFDKYGVEGDMAIDYLSEIEI